MVKKLHRPHATTPTRCALRIAAPAQDWHLCQPLCVEPWDGFTRVYPRYQTRYYTGLVDKMRRCGNPDTLGSIAYRCLHGGQGTHLVAMRGQSSRCWRCAQVDVDNWGRQGSPLLPEGVIYRPIVLTVPASLRQTFSPQAHAVLSPCMRCGVRGLEDVGSRVRGRALPGGYIVVVQTHGRHGQYHPHLHAIATRGGGDQQAPPWSQRDSGPSRRVRKQWQWPLWTRRRPTVKTPELGRWIDTCDPRSRAGCVTNVHQGDGPTREQSCARSLAQDVVSPPSALRRLDRDDGQRGTSHSRAPPRERVAWDTVAVDTVIGRLVRPGLAKGCPRIRSDGVPATKTCAKRKSVMQAALAQGQGFVQEALQISAPLPSRPRYQQRTGRAPWRWPHCQSAMDVWRLWHPL